MEKKENSNFNQLLMVFLGGAVIGAVLGVLFAPAKGSETRTRVSDTIKDLAGDLADKFNGGDPGNSENKS